MKVAVFVKANKDSEAGVMPTEELLSAMGKYNEELVKAGVMLDGAGLHPSSRGVRVNFSNGEPRVTKGPFTESKDLVSGYWLWKVNSLDEAIDWIKRAPFDDADLELRPLFDFDDFEQGPAIEKERELAKELERRKKEVA
jgi:hypothetical protein